MLLLDTFARDWKHYTGRGIATLLAQYDITNLTVAFASYIHPSILHLIAHPMHKDVRGFNLLLYSHWHSITLPTFPLTSSFILPSRSTPYSHNILGR